MILFFRTPQQSIIAAQTDHELTADEVKELCWLYGDATPEAGTALQGWYVGPRREMISPWSTNAVEIAQNMNITGLRRIEEYFPVETEDAEYDPMLQRLYRGLDQEIFTITRQPEAIRMVENIEEENEKETKSAGGFY